MQISDVLGMQIFAPGANVKSVEKGSDLPVFSLELASGSMEIDLVAGAGRGALSDTGFALLEDQGFAEQVDFAALAAEMPPIAAEPQSRAIPGPDISVGKSPGDVALVRRTILGADYSADRVVEVPKPVVSKTDGVALNTDVLPAPAPTSKEPQAVPSVKMNPLADVTDKNDHKLAGPELKSDPPQPQHSLKPEAALPATAGAQTTTSILRTDNMAEPKQQIGSLSQSVPKDGAAEDVAMVVPRDLEGSQPKPEGPKPLRCNSKLRRPTVPNPV